MESFTFISLLQIRSVGMTESCRSVMAISEKWVEDLSLTEEIIDLETENPLRP